MSKPKNSDHLKLLERKINGQVPSHLSREQLVAIRWGFATRLIAGGKYDKQ